MDTSNEKKKSSTQGKSYLFLFIGDDEKSAEFIQSRLKGSRHRLITASEGGKGYQMVESGNPDLILLDYKLSDMNGIDFLKK